jgi:hypothetical protein
VDRGVLLWGSFLSFCFPKSLILQMKSKYHTVSVHFGLLSQHVKFRGQFIRVCYFFLSLFFWVPSTPCDI